VEADGDSLSASDHRDNDSFGILSDRESWRVTLPSVVGLELRLELNAGSSTVELSGASIETINLNLNAGSVILDLGSVEDLGLVDVELNAGALDLTLPNQSLIGSIEANAGSVNVCTPAGTALRFNTEGSNLSSFDFEDQGLFQDGSTWQTPGFESAAVRIELDVRTNAGSFSLNPEDGCRG
jgi:hypothetical protein